MNASAQDAACSPQRSEFMGSLRKGLLLGAAALVLLLPPVDQATGPVAAIPEQAMQSGTAANPAVPAPVSAPAPVVMAPPLVFAAFGQEEATADARHLANWAFYSRDNGGRAVVIVDKKDARVHVFNPRGKLIASAPALLGSATGDHTAPGVGDKPLSQVLADEKTTPAGRFIAEPGINTKGEDIVWVDYDAAVSMHRVRANVKAERRLERLASASVDDNRISFGCINLPIAFYENVLSPTVKRLGAIVYVLPETRPVREVFNSYDPPAAVQYAQR